MLISVLIWSALTALFLTSHEVAAVEFELDDAWIHHVYARSLWTEGNFNYNSGVAESGFTSPLWVILLAPLHGISAATGLSLVLLTRLLSGALAAATTVVLARTAAHWMDERAQWFTVAASLSSTLFVFGAFSGMEVSLAGLCVAGALYAAICRLTGVAGTLLALATLARPEAAVVSVVVFAAEQLRRMPAQERLLRTVQLAWPSVLAGSLWLAWDLRHTGHLLPNTFYAKSDGSFNVGVQHWWNQVFVGFGATRWILLAPATAAGAWLLLRRHLRESGAWLAAAAGMPVAIVLTAELAPHVGFYMSRYFAPFSILLAPVAGVGLSWMAGRASSGRLRPFLAPMVVLASLPSLLAGAQSFGDHCRDVELLHTRPFRDLSANVPPTTVVAVEGAGASRFHLRGRVVDLVGLNDHVRVHLTEPADQMCHVVLAQPTVFVIPSDWVQRYATGFELEVVARYEQPDWSVVHGVMGRAVVIARARPLDGIVAFCRGRQ